MLTKQSLQRILKRILLREEKDNHCQKTIEKKINDDIITGT